MSTGKILSLQILTMSIYSTFLFFYMFYVGIFLSLMCKLFPFFLLNDELIEMTKYNAIDNGTCTRGKDIDECSYDIFSINCVKCC